MFFYSKTQRKFTSSKLLLQSTLINKRTSLMNEKTVVRELKEVREIIMKFSLTREYNKQKDILLEREEDGKRPGQNIKRKTASPYIMLR